LVALCGIKYLLIIINIYNLDQFIGMNKRELIDWMINNLIEPSKLCEKCNENLLLKQTDRNRDQLGWRCFKNGCLKYGIWVQIRKNLFFDGTVADLMQLLKAILLVDWPSTIRNTQLYM